MNDGLSDDIKEKFMLPLTTELHDPKKVTLQRTGKGSVEDIICVQEQALCCIAEFFGKQPVHIELDSSEQEQSQCSVSVWMDLISVRTRCKTVPISC